MFYYTGSFGEQKVKIFIPEFYLTQAMKYIEPIDGKKLLENVRKAKDFDEAKFKKKENEIISMQRKFRGERAEKNLYHGLKDFFENRDEVICVIFGYKILRLDVNDKENNTTEKDCIIINLDKKYIMVFEAKHNLPTFVHKILTCVCK